LVEPEAEARQIQGTRAFYLQWASVLNENLFLQLRGSLTNEFIGNGPQSCQWDPKNCENIPAIQDITDNFLKQNYLSETRTLRNSVELSGSLDWYADSRRFGSNTLRIGAKFWANSDQTAITTTGNSSYLVAGTLPVAREQDCSNDPMNDNGNCHGNWLYSSI